MQTIAQSQWLCCLLAVPAWAANVDSLRLNIDPMQSGVSLSLILRASGDLQFFQYNRYQLTMQSERSARMPELAQLFERSRAPRIQSAFERKFWGQPGLTQGDQFELELGGGSATAEFTGGFLEDAPAVLKTYLHELADFGLRAAARPLAPAYLRCSKVDAERRTYLEKRGQQFQRIAALPTLIREPFEKACARPGEFVPLTQQQGLTLSSVRSAEWEFVLIGASSFQSTKFLSAPGESPAKEKK